SVRHELLLPPSGGYRKLKTFQLARVIYDVTFRFCDTYVDQKSRTHDQMLQAARSGVQNIAEGSVDSATSKKSELHLTNIARGSLAELGLDYEDYLRQHGCEIWSPAHPALQRFKALRCASLQEFRDWVRLEMRDTVDTDCHGPTRTDTRGFVLDRVGPCKSVTSVSTVASVYAANGALSLINLCDYLLGRQLARLGEDFVNQGGFRERMHRVRTQARRN
ncbi:MAG: four helix bundle suffix domain-containing protein, partial [Kiritimatiellia bacterium]